ncbi:MAG: hypothetical protein K2J90_09655 [Lachnospiraceae bacterium]|nr:hypothetical protein [Lachnospiraceae bacterium]
MRFNKHLFWIMIAFFGLIFLLGSSNTAEAKKYYSLKEIGLSGCTTDNVDYAIFSIRGNTVKYSVYKFSSRSREWERVSGVKVAKLTSKTKYYMGDSQKVSSSLKKYKEDGKNKNIRSNNKKYKTADNRKHFAKKDINTEKWIYRVRKGTIKKNIFGRNNEIQVKNGKVTKLIVRLVY